MFLLELSRNVLKDIPRFRAHLMVFIARFGFFVLSLLVIFAFFEVRYDTIRRRDSGDVPAKYQPIVNVLD